MHSPKNSKIAAPAVVTPERVTTKKVVDVTPTKSPFGFGSPTKNKSSDEVKEVYELINKATGFIGGNAYNSAMYGELTRGSMQQILNILKEKCELDKRSCFIDIGSGLGKPNFHAAQEGTRLSIGVELVNIRHQLCMQNLLKVLQHGSETINTTGVNFICADITKAQSLNPFTHIYQFDLGFEPPLHHYIANMFNRSASTQYLISYRRPMEIEKYGYNCTLVTDVSTAMSGSGEGHKCYFYKKCESSEASKNVPDTTLLSVPLDDSVLVKIADERACFATATATAGASAGTAIAATAAVSSSCASTKAPKKKSSSTESKTQQQQSNDLQCDPLFAPIIQLSLTKSALIKYTKDFIAEYFSAARITRSSSRSPVRYKQDGSIESTAIPVPAPAGPAKATLTPPRTPPRTPGGGKRGPKTPSAAAKDSVRITIFPTMNDVNNVKNNNTNNINSTKAKASTIVALDTDAGSTKVVPLTPPRSTKKAILAVTPTRTPRSIKKNINTVLNDKSTAIKVELEEEEEEEEDDAVSSDSENNNSAVNIPVVAAAAAPAGGTGKRRSGRAIVF